MPKILRSRARSTGRQGGQLPHVKPFKCDNLLGALVDNTPQLWHVKWWGTYIPPPSDAMNPYPVKGTDDGFTSREKNFNININTNFNKDSVKRE